MEIYPEQGKLRTSVDIPIALREEIKRRGMTISGALVEGLKAMDERKTWNADKEQRLHDLELYQKNVIKERHIARMKREMQNGDGQVR